MFHTAPYTIESPGYLKVAGESLPRRHPRAKHGLLERPTDGVRTVFDIVRNSAKLYPHHKTVGTRRLIKMHREIKIIEDKKKEWVYYELGPYNYLNYSQYEQLTIEIGSGLRKLGLSSSSKVYLFGTTSANWISMSHGCASQAIPIVTGYDTLSAKDIQYSLSQTQSEAIYLDPHLVGTADIALENSQVKTVIINTDCIFSGDYEIADFKGKHPQLKVIAFEELIQLGRDNLTEPTPISPSDLFCIMYTSGSTGRPKGCCISHENFVAGITGLLGGIDDFVSDRERVLAYLPLAHIFEMALENLVMYIGGTLGYGNPKTLTDASLRNCHGDMIEFKPTIMVGVPQIWETIRKAVLSRLDYSGIVAKTVFWTALGLKSLAVRYSLPYKGVLDDLVFGRVRQMTGGRLRYILNGSSGIANDTKEFLSLIVAEMLTGYGLTETCANGALGSPFEQTTSAIGPTSPAMDVKLVSIPELGYFTDAGFGPCQGEILVHGPVVFKEYFKNPEATEKAFTRDGWFRTGDIGEFDDRGHLKIIDRVKSLVKMQSGEYIALEKLESIYRTSQAILQVMVHADCEYTRPIVIIMPNTRFLQDKFRGLGFNDDESALSSERVSAYVLKDLQAIAKRSGLTKIETVAGVVVTDLEWTPQSGLVTATMKLNRRFILSYFRDEVEKCMQSLR
ncbi:fumonisin cluster-fatty acyl-CoA Synthase [Fusarium fujikuroi IMI 58289]|uniref:Fumonisin cluster-fatty acyl-CoA Synthase n=1 Tax=Gibberella fujikuroi (strain CBS 195.34 / IMI 58289 / NRRL A-6831) TaxID=1279085 RepID=S0EN66_GIBF5|nr:fumonisin cluster-fatty acyl-CoA Synthase [Fusarium fujikuroi IMI 58289]CCT73918.1 fumonisin cluster-fatty acyl-CoA Synthase [Fusarium fujikuroi IMI 58289]SCO06473.1 fumonisin cluster-fatty acyl-CoA Synthase [Fusarium fujikuroi]SCO09433.1 fumonisin cluster-fatty acyl-CoA Synthase [Fusarium fujikuroi]SCO46796.1 fumonisin cluster-fatty acyl-CoA Synthase [Fusarium fujikuroi]